MKSEEAIIAMIDDINEEIKEIRQLGFRDDYDYEALADLYAKRDILRWVMT